MSATVVCVGCEHQEDRALAAEAMCELLRVALAEQRGNDGHAPPWVQSVTLAAIAEQRRLGWPDFHPEDFCHRCGHRNMQSWASTVPDLWASLPVDGLPPSHIICPSCFDALYAQEHGSSPTWEVRPL